MMIHGDKDDVDGGDERIKKNTEQLLGLFLVLKSEGRKKVRGQRGLGLRLLLFRQILLKKKRRRERRRERRRRKRADFFSF